MTTYRGGVGVTGPKASLHIGPGEVQSKQPKSDRKRLGLHGTASTVSAGGSGGTTSGADEDGVTPRRRKKWAARYVALHCHADGSWTLSWAKKPTAEAASGKVVLCDRCVLLPATGLRFGLRTPKRALRLQASDARTLAKWLAVLASALADDDADGGGGGGDGGGGGAVEGTERWV